MPYIPKRITTMWYGSDISDKKQGKRVANWKKLHPRYEVVVNYKSSLLSDKAHLTLKEWAKQNQILLVDEDKNPPHQNQENQLYIMAGPYPNYAEGSDLGRFPDLDENGGIYLDTDIEFDEHNLLPGATDDKPGLFAEHGILLNNFPQGMLKKQLLGNDIVASVPGHDFIKFIIEEQHNQYADTATFPLPQDLESYRKDAKHQTVEKTGPLFFTRAVKKYVDSKRAESQMFTKYSDEGEKIVIKLKDEYCLDPKYFVQEENDLSWLEKTPSQKLSDGSFVRATFKLPEKKYLNFEAYCQDIVIKIQYEQNHYATDLLNEYIKATPAEFDKTRVKEYVLNEIKKMQKIEKKREEIFTLFSAPSSTKNGDSDDKKYEKFCVDYIEKEWPKALPKKKKDILDKISQSPIKNVLEPLVLWQYGKNENLPHVKDIKNFISDVIKLCQHPNAEANIKIKFDRLKNLLQESATSLGIKKFDEIQKEVQRMKPAYSQYRRI